MAQISRPFQIALLALALLVAVWFVALRGHSPNANNGAAAQSSSTSTPTVVAHANTVSTPSAPVTAAGEEHAAAAPTPVYHGAAPGLEGLTRDIAKAHGAVAESQAQAKQFEHQSAEGQAAPTATATTPAVTTPAPASTTPAATPAATAKTKTTTAVAVKTGAKAGATSSHTTSAAALHSGEVAVAAELKRGDVVVLLFWNPAGADDVAVRKAVLPLASARRRVAVHVALADQVASFGSITKGVQVDQTPTVLVIAPAGRVTALSGLTDTYSIEQAIDEARL